MKRILLALLILSVVLVGCAQKVTESDDDISLEDVQEDEISQELGQDIENIDTLGEDDFGLGTDFDDFESDLESLEW